MLRCVAPAAACFLLLASPWMPTARAQNDRVYDGTGVAQPGIIVQTTADEITLEQTGVPRKIPSHEVKRLIFGDEPAQLTQARDSIAKGALEEAATSLKEIDVSGITRDLVIQELLYFQLYIEAQMSMRGTGNKKTAAENMLKFVAKYKTSYHFYEAAEVLGDLALATGDFANATKYYSALARSPADALKNRAVVLEARAMLGEGKFADALTRFDQVIAAGANAKTPEARKQVDLAKIGRAVCLAGTGKPEEGIKQVETIIAQGDPRDTELFARAHNALGACLAKAKRNKEALYAYLYTDTLFYSNPDAHAEALYNLATLWKLDNKSERSLKARETLKSRYAGTYWADLP